MRMRVSAATLKRVERVEQARSVMRPTAAWPAPMSLAEWEAVSVPQQQALIEWTRETLTLGAAYRNGPIETDPMDATHLHKPGKHTGGIIVRS